MNPFNRSKDYEDSRRIIDYSSTFNTATKLEFNILPDKRYLSLRETLLTFSIELPQEVFPDNFLGSTIFENLGKFDLGLEQCLKSLRFSFNSFKRFQRLILLIYLSTIQILYYIQKFILITSL